jgi:fibronectin type 3 domain-containing protein
MFAQFGLFKGKKMKNKLKWKAIRRIAGIIAIVAIIGFIMIACDLGDVGDDGNEKLRKTPTVDDFDINGIGTVYFDGEEKSVTITAITDKTSGKITVYYESIDKETYPKVDVAPIDFGTYNVTFDVAAATGWNSASELSAGTLIIADGAPGIPTGLNATVQSRTSIRVNWNSVSRATSYNVYYITEKDESLIFAGSITGTSYNHTGLIADTNYWYYVTSVNNYGESNYSQHRSVATKTPQAPATVVVTATGSNTLTVRWASVTGAAGYRVYYNTSGPSGNKLSWANNYYTGTSCDVVNAAGNTTYYFFITAVNAIGESDYSQPGSARTFSGGTFNAGLTATVHGGSGLTLSWNRISNATFYNVIYTTGSPDNQKYYATSFSGLTYWTSPPGWMQPNTTYYFWITVIRGFNTESGLSEMLMVRTGSPSPIPPTPPGLPPVPPGGGSGQKMCTGMYCSSGACNFTVMLYRCQGGYRGCFSCRETGISNGRVCTVCNGARQVKCGVCNGTGKCSRCNGTGKI